MSFICGGNFTSTVGVGPRPDNVSDSHVKCTSCRRFFIQQRVEEQPQWTRIGRCNQVTQTADCSRSPQAPRTAQSLQHRTSGDDNAVDSDTNLAHRVTLRSAESCNAGRTIIMGWPLLKSSSSAQCPPPLPRAKVTRRMMSHTKRRTKHHRTRAGGPSATQHVHRCSVLAKSHDWPLSRDT